MPRSLSPQGWCLIAALPAWLLAVTASASETWPRLPTDAEIEGARDRLVAELTQENPSCQQKAAACASGPDEISRQVCIAQACMHACRLGPETRKSKPTAVELLKAHNPEQPTVASAQVLALVSTEQTTDDCNGQLSESTSHFSMVLEFGDVLIPESAGTPAALGRDWVFRHEGFDTGVHQTDPSSRAQRDAVIASYFEPGRFVHGFPGEAAPVAEYRMAVTAPDERHPLRFVLLLEQRVPAAAPDADSEAEYRPAPDTRIELSALRFNGNEQRLAAYFETRQCQNCQDSEVHGHRTQSLSDPAQPIVLVTDRDGRAAIEFFLDFGALTQARLLQPGVSITVPVLFAARAAAGSGPLRTVAQEQLSARLDGIGVVDAVTYEPPQLFDPLSEQPLPRGPEAPLSSYLDDTGTRDGPRTLVREERAIVNRQGEAGIGASGSTPGRTLTSAHVLQVADRITVNACGMVGNRTVAGLPVGEPGRIWVRVRFFDGLRGQFGVSAKVCRAGLSIGLSGEATGFTSGTTRFVYWAAESGVDAALVWLYPSYAVASYTRKVIKALSWLGGFEAVYVVLESAVSVEFDEDGAMQISTRQGTPRVQTAQTDAEGVLVDAGNSARVAPDGSLQLSQTDAGRASRADGWLAGLEAASSLADTSSAGDEWPTGYPTSTSPDGNESSDIDWTTALMVGLPVMLVVVLIGRLRGRRPAAVAAAPASPPPTRARARAKKSPSTTTEASPAPKAFCSQCGKPHAPSAKFCGHCGARLTVG